jgi:hypothetical protein
VLTSISILRKKQITLKTQKNSISLFHSQNPILFCELLRKYELKYISIMAYFVTTPLWAKCENETHTPKSGDLESSGTHENSELDCRGQNTSHWGVLCINGKVLKFRCPKCPRKSHLNIFSPSYGQKKVQESNWQFDSQPLKVRNQPLPDVYEGVRLGIRKLSKRATTLV